MLKDILFFVRKNRFQIALIVIIVFIVYFNSLGATFISDDNDAIVFNSNIGTLESLKPRSMVFIHPFWYFIAYKIGGGSPFFYHLVNVLSHLGVSLSLYAL